MRVLFQTRLLVKGKPVEYSIFQKSLQLFYAVPSTTGESSDPRVFYIVKDNDEWMIWDEEMNGHASTIGEEIERFFAE